MSNPAFEAIDLSTIRSRAGAKWNRYPGDVLAAWVADMDFAAPEPIRKAIRAIVDNDDYGYPWLREHNPVIPAFVDWQKRQHDWELDPEMIAMTSDVLQGIQAFVSLYSEPGDGIAIQTPIYPPFLMATNENSRQLVDNPLGEPRDGYGLDVEGLSAAVDERTRVLLLCNPHNPSGRVFTLDELTALGELAVERDLLIVSDEIHADLVHVGTHIPIAAIRQEFADRTVTLTSATKAFNIAGLRLAVVVFGSPEIKKRWDTIHRFTWGGVNSLGVAATAAAWSECGDWLDDLMVHLDGNRRQVERFVADHLPGVDHVAPQATFLAWLDCRELIADGRTEHPFQFFLDHGVALNDGRDFGEHGDPFVRLSFATSRYVLDQILERMAEAVR